MLFAISASFLVLVVFGWCWQHRNRYAVLRAGTSGRVREQIITLPVHGIQNPKLRAEVKLFNRLNLVMPTVRGVAVAYTQLWQALLDNPKHRPGADPYERLFYGYACDVLLRKVPDPLVQRQLRHNLWFLLASRHKIVQRRQVVWSARVYELYPTPHYKIFNHSFVDLTQPVFSSVQPLRLTVHGSYLKYQNEQLLVRQFEDFFELKAATTQTVTFRVAADKTEYDCRIARGVVTCQNLVTGQTQTWACRGEKVRLATSVCAKTDALQIYLTFQGEATVSHNRGRRQLLTDAVVAFNRQVEQIVMAAEQAKYVRGERLRERYHAAEKYVPSLRLLTRVVPVTQPSDFFAVLDCLSQYERAAQLFGGFNLVFLYSGANRMVADLVAGFLTAEQVAAYRDQRLLLFFVDRTVTEPDALYFLSKMTKPQAYALPCPLHEQLSAPLTSEIKVTKTFPYQKTYLLTNPTAQPVRIALTVPLIFTTPQVVTARGTTLTAVGLESGRATLYQLPVAFNLENELLTTHVNWPLKVNLLGFEQKKFVLRREIAAVSRQERSKQFWASLENIVVTTQDKKLNQIFAKPISETENPTLLKLVKSAYQNVDAKLLVAVLGDKNQLPVDVWQFLLSKLVGLRPLRGKVHLVPCLNLMGEFTVAFTCQGKPYNFTARKGLPDSAKMVTISHG